MPSAKAGGSAAAKLLRLLAHTQAKRMLPPDPIEGGSNKTGAKGSYTVCRIAKAA
jgi:hypothetical protein